MLWANIAPVAWKKKNQLDKNSIWQKEEKITRRWNEAKPKEPTLIQKKVMLQKTRDTAKEKKENKMR